MAECHRKFCIRSHGCVSRSCLFIVCVPLIPPHLAKHPKAKFDVITPLGYVNHYGWFSELIGGIRVLNTGFNNGRTGYSSKAAFDWEKSSYLSRWEPSGNSSIFVGSTPKEEHLGVRAAGLQKWAVSKLTEQHI